MNYSFLTNLIIIFVLTLTRNIDIIVVWHRVFFLKQLTTKKLLQEQPFYKQPIKKPRIKKSSNHELLRQLPFYDDINISRNKRVLRGYAETYKVEIINNRNLSDLLSVIKNSIKNLFDELLRKKKGVLNIL